MSNYNAEYQRAWRAANKARIKAHQANRARRECRPTKLPDHIVAEGQEMARMMMMSAAEYAATYLNNGE